MKSRRNKRLNRICCHQFEDRIAFYSKWGKFRSGGLWASRGLEIRRPGVGVPLAVICRVVRPGAQQAGEPEGGAAGHAPM